MINRKKIGLDKWKVPVTSTVFLENVRQFHPEVYDITIHQKYVQFYAPITQRSTLYKAFEQGVLLETTGMLGYLLRSLVKPFRVLSALSAILLWYALSHMVFEIEIKGEKDESRGLIKQTLQDLEYQVPFYQQDVSKMKNQLKKKLENDIAWLEIEKQGSRYVISYTPKEFATLKSPGQDELIAQKDGVIEHFEIEHGSKEYKVNDFVHKGDVLVRNTLVDSKGKTQELFVDGRVFAYVWKDVEVTMPAHDLPKSFQYFEMLMEARSEVSKDFKKDDQISEENILQFSKDMGKIKMVVHYKLIQDITTP